MVSCSCSATHTACPARTAEHLLTALHIRHQPGLVRAFTASHCAALLDRGTQHHHLCRGETVGASQASLADPAAPYLRHGHIG